MFKDRLKLAGATIAVTAGLAFGGYALAGGFLTNGLPQAGGSQYPSTIPLTGNELLPADTQLSSGQMPQSEAISLSQLDAFMNSRPSNENFIIGGDAGTNLWQRGTTGSSVTTTATFGGPDRWFYWSGTNTAMTVSQSNTAAALPAAYSQTFRMQRTAAQTGVVQMCMAQEVESNLAVSMAGTTVELDFHAFTGANFSPAAPFNMNAYVIYGTGTNDGAAKLAFGLNGGGGGGSGWTGQANASAGLISLGGVSTLGRYAVVAAIPATATEVGVALCYTPTGTAGTTDAVYFSGIQLLRNPSLTANATTGFSCDNTSNVQIQCTSFLRRAQAVESVLQYRYYYELDESATIWVAGACKAESVTVATCFVQFPVVMRSAPAMTYANGFATETTTAGGTLGACNTLATASTVASTASNVNGILVGCTATTVPAAGSAAMLYSNNGTGKIKANAEMT